MLSTTFANRRCSCCASPSTNVPAPSFTTMFTLGRVAPSGRDLARERREIDGLNSDDGTCPRARATDQRRGPIASPHRAQRVLRSAGRARGLRGVWRPAACATVRSLAREGRRALRGALSRSRQHVGGARRRRARCRPPQSRARHASVCRYTAVTGADDRPCGVRHRRAPEQTLRR